jgi:competence protein ComEC
MDCGSLTHHALAARKVNETLVRRAVDLLVLSHSDADHWNGVVDLLQKVPVLAAALPVEMRNSEAARLLAAQGTALHWLAPGDEWSFHSIGVHRPPVDERHPNDECLWSRLHLPCAEVLLPADASERAIDAALADGMCGPAQVLALPHHGRPNHRSEALLAAVRPALCLVSNRAGEGHSVQGDGALHAGAEVWATGECGDLELRFTDRVGLQAARPRPSAAGH